MCVAVIGKENSPLYIVGCSDCQELNFHYSRLTSLDVVEEKLTAGTTNKASCSDHRDLYLGSLNSSENQKVFSYVTNTNIKFIIIVDYTNTSLGDNVTRLMFRKLHTAYMNVVANPFYVGGGGEN